MSDVNKRIEEAIKKLQKMQLEANHDILDDKFSQKEIQQKLSHLGYEGIRINLQTQREMFKKIHKADKITTLAYRVAVISLGASLISILSYVLNS